MNTLTVALVLAFACVASCALVRFAHASPDAPAVDIEVDGLKVFRDLKFKGVTFYAPLPAAKYNVSVVAAGTTGPAVIQVDEFDVTHDQIITVAAAGKLANIGPVVFMDDTRRPNNGFVAIRFVHLSPDAPAVDIAVKGGPVLFKNIAFKGASTYAQVKPGKYDLEVRVAGTTTVALDVPGVELGPDRIYSVFAEGLLATKSLTAVLHWDL
mmetsp:Transcript_3620/g.4007  ORF Transcript_3620/g.4007 Transcript_3620/m.4007 type:complete len:211 (-) Transcript_3620:37-669(-)|eukprot:CAMPEP_0168508246 /NCGR_PEP_ID=MMETSP0405-20121227/4_1 /TAXON_ID=498012 /ORGANISM="Trichosphaerium sp, Strain Am-I-7 wt" /LENGTH=210 /DNA_ID=CAMNT_0008525353 /DNA_START=17 /DNA_END=649 /DNA_ORIENTATION=-